MDSLMTFLLLSSGSFGGIVILIDFIIAPLTLGWKFDKLFRGKMVTPFEPGIPYLNMIARCMVYMLVIIFYDKKNKRPYQRTIMSPECKQYDFRGNASKFEIIISFMFFYSFILWISLGVVYIIANFVFG